MVRVGPQRQGWGGGGMDVKEIQHTELRNKTDESEWELKANVSVNQRKGNTLHS